jgi:ATP-binding protein involved in chromosome partitioning
MGLFGRTGQPPPPAQEVSENQVLEALKSVQDPDLHKDIVTLGFVKELAVRGGAVAFTIELTTPACPVKEQIKGQAEHAVRSVPGVREVNVRMDAQVAASRPLMAKGVIDGVKNVIAVSSGKGGVGKSTVAVNLACALHASGARVGILDADVYGPNVPLMMGVSGRPESHDRKIVPFERHGVSVMSMGFLVADDQPVIWRGPMLHGAIKQFLFDVAWRDLDYLVVDLPPGTGDAQLSLAQQAHLMGAVIVTTPQDVSVLDVKKAISMFGQVNVPVLGIVENMAGLVVNGRVHGPTQGVRVVIDGTDGAIDAPLTADGRFSATIDLFGSGGAEKLMQRFGLPLLGRVPLDPQVRIAGDAGLPIVLAHPESPAAHAFRAVAGAVAARISTLNLMEV